GRLAKFRRGQRGREGILTLPFGDVDESRPAPDSAVQARVDEARTPLHNLAGPLPRGEECSVVLRVDLEAVDKHDHSSLLAFRYRHRLTGGGGIRHFGSPPVELTSVGGVERSRDQPLLSTKGKPIGAARPV